MSASPQLALAFPSQSAEQFWNVACRELERDKPQIIGLDGDQWLEKSSLKAAADWVTTLRAQLNRPEQDRVFLTTIIFLKWPERRVPDLEEEERFRALALAGANLRTKQAPPYVPGTDVTKEQFATDLALAGILASASFAPTTPGPLPPEFTSEEEKQEHQQRLRFYEAPPFTWTKQAIDELYGKRT